MDKILQNKEELQDEELYALLDRALETERLCVSEELIQKTLARVTEEDDSKVVSFETAKKRKIPVVKYISVAAAAVFVVFVGVRTLGNGGLAKNDASMEAKYDNAGHTNETLLADTVDGSGTSAAGSLRKGTEYYYSVSDSDAVIQHETAEDMTTYTEAPEDDTSETEFPKSEASEGNGSVLEGTVMTISAELTEALTAVGAEPVSGEAEYWEFVQRDATWEKELFYELAAAMDVFGETLPTDGRYCYSLDSKGGGRQTVYGTDSLDGIVRIETKKGILWGLFGETVRLYTE